MKEMQTRGTNEMAAHTCSMSQFLYPTTPNADKDMGLLFVTGGWECIIELLPWEESVSFLENQTYIYQMI